MYLDIMFFFRKDSKSLPRFLLDEEKKKKASAPSSSLNGNWAKNHTTEESPAHPTQLDTTIQHQLVESTPANQLSQLTPPLAAGRRPLNSTLLEQTLHHWHHPRNTTAKTTH